MHTCQRHALIVLAVSSLALAGQAASTLRGTVRDPQNAVMAGVTVTLADANDIERTATTNERGEFSFENLQAGTYRVRVGLPGFGVFTRRVDIAAGQAATIDIRFGATAAPPPPPPPPPPPLPLPQSPPPLTSVAAGTPQYTKVPVLYATDRLRQADAAFGADFSRERGSTDDLQYGRATVTIPRDHRLGELEAPRWLHLEFRPDPSRDVTLQRSEAVDRTQFFSDLRATATDRDVLVFIHGYNVTFEDALRRTGQLAYDLQFKGPAVAYTWPGQDNPARYLIAVSNVDWCKPHLLKFLTEIADDSGARRIHVIVHSLGNRIFAHAVDAIVTANPARKALFHNVVMAAADLDVDEFRQLAAKMKQSTDSLTLYVSQTDKALKASKDLAKYARVGQGGSKVVLLSGIDTIDATQVDKGFFWDVDHSYFGDSASVVSDLWQLIGCDWKVAQRDALKAVGSGDPRLWRLLPKAKRRDACVGTRPIKE
jgi:esterase/lipase superfamily enzyme